MIKSDFGDGYFASLNKYFSFISPPLSFFFSLFPQSKMRVTLRGDFYDRDVFLTLNLFNFSNLSYSGMVFYLFKSILLLTYPTPLRLQTCRRIRRCRVHHVLTWNYPIKSIYPPHGYRSFFGIPYPSPFLT